MDWPSFHIDGSSQPDGTAFDEMQAPYEQDLSMHFHSSSQSQVPHEERLMPPPMDYVQTYGDQLAFEDDAYDSLDDYDRKLLAEPSNLQQWTPPEGQNRLSLPTRASTFRHLAAPFNTEAALQPCARNSQGKQDASTQILSNLSGGLGQDFGVPQAVARNSSPPFSITSSPSFQVHQRRKAQSAKKNKKSVPTSNPPAGPTHHPIAIGTPTEYHQHGELPLVWRGIQLVPPHELPDRFRSVFPFKLFTPVQSACFSLIYKANDNVVLSAPTASGKTAVLELAICRILATRANDQYKIVYMAPTKSLCSERQRDWQSKFHTLGLSCAEMTGDTDASQTRKVQSADIIITTPEKWDSMTRKWKDQQRLMQLVKLFLIDEVHILKETRGATLEAVVSRMKSVGREVRFVALSATIPNSDDIATWVGKNSTEQHEPAFRKVFGEEFRPVVLQKHVCGISYRGNDFGFDAACRKRIPDIVAQYSSKKPIMIFCCTRASATETAKLLAQIWASSSSSERLWSGPSHSLDIQDSVLKGLVMHGVAFHHAGLDQTDRATVEHGFLQGDIGVICCTSTLAVGVNLPCHLVIVQNTVSWQAGGLKEYSHVELTQMLGRAGRPQFGDSGVAVIVTKEEKVQKYKQIVAGEELLESCLHLNLIDHLNAEIGLGTIDSLRSAKRWLAGTFLYVRLAKNPGHYNLDSDGENKTLDEMVEQVCKRDISLLQEAGLVHKSENLGCTAFGEAMAQYYVKFQSMRTFLSLPSKAKLSELLCVLAESEEFHDVRFRVGEKTLYKTLNAANGIKFPIKADIATSAHKRSIIIQSELGGVEFPMDEQFRKFKTQFSQDRGIIFSNVHRLIRCIADCQLHTQDAVAARNALELGRSLGARVWDSSPLQMKQIPGLGPFLVRKLVNADINSIEALEATDPGRVNLILGKQHGFGYDLQQKLSNFPKLRVSIKQAGHVLKKGESPLVKFSVEMAFMNDRTPEFFCKKPVYVCCLVERSDGLLVDFRRMKAREVGKEDLNFSSELLHDSQTISCYAMCDEMAGTLRSALMTPKLPSLAFTFRSVAAEAGTGASSARSRLPHAFSRSGFLSASEVLSRENYIFRPDLNDSEMMDVADTVEFREIEEVERCLDTRRADDTGEVRTGQSQRDRLGNGKWACSHKCKDKTVCKHLCCREGVEKPRRLAKNKEWQEASLQQHAAEVALLSRTSEAGSLPEPLQTLKRKQGNTAEERPSKKAKLSSIDLEDDFWLPELSPLLKAKQYMPDIDESKLRDDEFDIDSEESAMMHELAAASHVSLDLGQASDVGEPSNGLLQPDGCSEAISVQDSLPNSTNAVHNPSVESRTPDLPIRSKFFANSSIPKCSVSETRTMESKRGQSQPLQPIENISVLPNQRELFNDMEGIDPDLYEEFKDYIDFV